MPMVNGRFVRPETVEKWQAEKEARDARKAQHADLFSLAWLAGVNAYAGSRFD